MKLQSLIWAVLVAGAVAMPPCRLQAQGISVRAAAHLVMNGAPTLVLNDASLLSNGVIASGNSTVVFAGSKTGRSVIGGTGALGFNNITINKSASDVYLSGTVAVSGILTMVSHNLQLNNHVLNLGSTGSLSGEGSQSYITDAGTGTITLNRVLSSPNAVNPGHIGVEISSSANLGTVSVTRGHAPQALSSGLTGISRYFNIIPLNNSNINATIRFYYLDAELDGLAEAALELWAASGKPSTWGYLGEDSINTNANWVLKTGIASFGSRYSLFNSTNGFPNARFRPSNLMADSAAMSNAVVLKGYPNPAHNLVTLTLTSPRESDDVLHLSDQWGNMLQSKQVHFSAGANTLQWDLSHYPAGVYYISAGGASPLKRIIIIHQ